MEVSAVLGISAMCRDPQVVGRAAAALALERIANPDAPARTVTLASTLVKRGSGELPP
jgi:LacI family transcriptional regulator